MSNAKMPMVYVKTPFRRITRLVGYLLLAMFGLAEAVLPTSLILNSLSWLFMLLFEGSLFFGGVFSAYSQLTHKYNWEIVGMPMLMGPLVVYGLQSFSHVDAQHLSRVGFGFACIGLTLVLYARWQDVRFIQKLADSLADEPDELLEDEEEPGE